MTIVFRSKVLNHTHTGNSYKTIQRRGSDWSNLRSYENDDIRDIAWCRSSGENIYVKDRQNQGAISLVGIFIGGKGDDFFIDNPFESKESFIEISKEKITKSAKESNYSITNYAGENLEIIGSKLLHLNTKNSLILIFHSFIGDFKIPQSILKLGGMNDIICVDIFHPFEQKPNNTIMIEGKVFSGSHILDYELRLSKYLMDKRQELNKKNISYIQINTNENLENRLNYFFKERYHGQ